MMTRPFAGRSSAYWTRPASKSSHTNRPQHFSRPPPAYLPDASCSTFAWPGVDGLEVQARLNRLRVRLPVIVMTGHGDVPSAVRAMKAGAIDFLEKPFGDETLLKVIEGAFARASRLIGDREAERAAQRIATLSPREQEVLDALLAGRPNKVIAFDLRISVRTVEVHRARMMERLGTKQFADAIRLAVMAKLAPKTRDKT
jgi:two-component system response regulator FixJ